MTDSRGLNEHQIIQRDAGAHVPDYATCPLCDGWRTVPELVIKPYVHHVMRTCPLCGGEGELSAEALRLMMESEE